MTSSCSLLPSPPDVPASHESTSGEKTERQCWTRERTEKDTTRLRGFHGSLWGGGGRHENPEAFQKAGSMELNQEDKSLNREELKRHLNHQLASLKLKTTTLREETAVSAHAHMQTDHLTLEGAQVG